MALFKIFRAAHWHAFMETGTFAGSDDDLRDGFIHLSDGEQVAGTIEKHFAGQAGLVIAEVDVGDDPELKWEPSRNGALFPHLFRALVRADVIGHETRA